MISRLINFQSKLVPVNSIRFCSRYYVCVQYTLEINCNHKIRQILTQLLRILQPCCTPRSLVMSPLSYSRWLRPLPSITTCWTTSENSWNYTKCRKRCPNGLWTTWCPRGQWPEAWTRIKYGLHKLLLMRPFWIMGRAILLMILKGLKGINSRPKLNHSDGIPLIW